MRRTAHARTSRRRRRRAGRLCRRERGRIDNNHGARGQGSRDFSSAPASGWKTEHDDDDGSQRLARVRCCDVVVSLRVCVCTPFSSDTHTHTEIYSMYVGRSMYLDM